MKRILSVALFVAACSSTPRPVAPNADEAKVAYAQKDYATFLTLARAEAQASPSSPRALYNLACAYALNGKPAKTADALGRLASLRVYFDITRDDDFAEVLATPEVTAARQKLEALKAAPVGRSQVAFTLQDRDLLTEGIAHDPASGTFFVSSVHERKILRIDRNGRATDFVPAEANGLFGVFGMAVDARRRVLWATSAVVPEMSGYRPEDEGRGGIFEIDLETGKLRRRVLLDARPPKRAPGDVAIGPRGEVYVTDATSGAVYELPEGAKAVNEIVPPATFKSPQGIVASKGALFVADYGRGLFKVDLATHAVTSVAPPADAVLTGIDGLTAYGNDLVAIQNGIEPHRVVRLALDPAGTRVVSATILEMNNPLFAEPTLGVVVENQYYFAARSQWARFDPAKPPALREEPLVLKMALE